LGELDGLRILDLFAGTGTLGIEAISRGADFVVFVDSAPKAVTVLRRNLKELAIEDSCRVVRCDAVAAIRRLGRSGERFDLVFLDAPYGSDALAPGLTTLVQTGVLTPHATVIVETAARRTWEPVSGLSLVDQRRYGDTLITRLKTVSESQDESNERCDGRQQ
jgi:16S rRNA (guanine(966)-N(2))-methyltransferase RsmD